MIVSGGSHQLKEKQSRILGSDMQMFDIRTSHWHGRKVVSNRPSHIVLKLSHTPGQTMRQSGEEAAGDTRVHCILHRFAHLQTALIACSSPRGVGQSASVSVIHMTTVTYDCNFNIKCSTELCAHAASGREGQGISLGEDVDICLVHFGKVLLVPPHVDHGTSDCG